MSKAGLDSEYLKTAVGDVLSKGIAQTIGAQPADPIEFLAQYLLKSVADEKADKVLGAQKKAATEAASASEAAAAKAKEEADAYAEAVKLQVEKEDKRLSDLLEGAVSTDEVFSAVLSYARARTGASGYVMMTDLPEKVMPKKVEPPPAEEAPADGEEAAEAPPAEEAEPVEPPPKFSPGALEYVAATSSDEALLLGKKLLRPPPMPEDDSPPPPTGVGEGVTFTAIDGYLSGGAKTMHIPKAVEDRAVKFWYLPRLGAYACAPFEDFEGDVLGVLGFDTLGLERAFTDAELSLLESLASMTGSHLKRIEEALAELHYAQVALLEEKYPKGEDGSYPAFASEDECSPVDLALGKVGVPAEVLKTLTADALKFLETRRTVSPAVAATIAGVCCLLSVDMAEALTPATTWSELKVGIAQGSLTWGDELFAAIGAFDVMAGAGEGGWAAAEAMVEELTKAPDEGEPLVTLVADASLVAKVLLDWLLAVVELHKAKVEADAAAAAPPPEPEAEE